MRKHRRRSFELKPFHATVVDEMDAVGSVVKNATSRAVTLARLIRRTNAPAGRDVIREALDNMVYRLGGIKNKRFNRTDRNELNGALHALVAQDDAACLGKIRAETEQPRLPAGVTEPAEATADPP